MSQILTFDVAKTNAGSSTFPIVGFTSSSSRNDSQERGKPLWQRCSGNVYLPRKSAVSRQKVAAKDQLWDPPSPCRTRFVVPAGGRRIRACKTKFDVPLRVARKLLTLFGHLFHNHHSHGAHLKCFRSQSSVVNKENRSRCFGFSTSADIAGFRDASVGARSHFGSIHFSCRKCCCSGLRSSSCERCFGLGVSRFFSLCALNRVPCVLVLRRSLDGIS